MEFVLGVLHLPPDAFWRMTLREYDAALAGHNRFHGGDQEAVDHDRMRALIAWGKEHHPDNPGPT